MTMQRQNLTDANKTSAIIQTAEVQYRGPLPHPSILADYAKVDSSFPERIMKMAEENNRAAIEHEELYLKEMLKIKKRGLTLSFTLGLLSLIAGVVFAFFSLSAVSITAILGGLAPILVASISSVKNSNADNSGSK